MPVNYDQDLVLVTAASGKQATQLVPRLVGKWKRLRLQVNSAASKERLENQYPDAEVVQVDLADAHACKGLLEGVTSCFMITPGFHHHETECGYNLIDAAVLQRKSGGPFQHMLYSSVLHPILRKLINHDSKRYVEEYLVESRLPYTIFQPTHLMETMPLAKLLNEEKPIYPANWNINIPFSFCTTRDLGQAAANVLEQRKKHYYATYQLVSTAEPLPYTEVIKIISEEIGKHVELKQKPFEEAIVAGQAMLGKGNPENASEAQTQGVSRMFLYYNERGLIGNPNVLEMLLGRRTMGYRGWVKQSVKELRQQ